MEFDEAQNIGSKAIEEIQAGNAITKNQYVLSRPQSTLWMVSKISLEIFQTSTFKSKKLGAIKFGILKSYNQMVLSFDKSEGELILVNSDSSSVMGYEKLGPVKFFSVVSNTVFALSPTMELIHVDL